MVPWDNIGSDMETEVWREEYSCQEAWSNQCLQFSFRPRANSNEMDKGQKLKSAWFWIKFNVHSSVTLIPHNLWLMINQGINQNQN